MAAAVAPLGSEAVVAVGAQLLVLPVRAHLEAVVAPALVLAHLPLLQAVVIPLVRAHLVLLALLRAVVVLPVLAVEAAPVHLRSRQSFSASTARISPSPVQPTYEQALSSR